MKSKAAFLINKKHDLKLEGIANNFASIIKQSILPVRVSAELLAVMGCTGTLKSLHSGLSTLLDNLLQNDIIELQCVFI